MVRFVKLIEMILESVNNEAPVMSGLQEFSNKNKRTLVFRETPNYTI